MKNKYIYVFLIFVTSFIFIQTVFAEDFAVVAHVDGGTTNLTKGNEVSIKINLSSSQPISDCKFKFESDAGIEFKTITSLNTWLVEETGADGVLVNNSQVDVIPVNGVKIVGLNYVVNNNGSVRIQNIECADKEGNKTYNAENINVSFTVKEEVPVENTTLKKLDISNEDAIQSLSVNNLDHIVNLMSPNFGLILETSDSKYQNEIVVTDSNGNTISDLNNIKFSDSNNRGEMQLYITVANTTRYSVLFIYKSQKFDSSLQSITINGKELTLNPGQYNYTFEVASDVTSINVAAVIKDQNNFKFNTDLGNAPGQFSIEDSVDAFIVVEPIDPQSGAVRSEYLIEIVRQGSTSEENGNENVPTPPPSGNNGNSGNGGNVSGNPQTGGTSMYLMALILVASLAGSIVLYRKNIEGYK